MNDNSTDIPEPPPIEQAAPPAKPSKGPSVFDGAKYMYAEQLQGKSVTLTIKRAVSGVEFTDGTGRKNMGIDVSFVETPKILGVTGMTVRRQLCAACGGEQLDTYPGKKIVLYSVASKKAATGVAIRIATYEAKQ